ncbi:DUF3885 domain-containing protein [Paenibacillus sp. LMG 31456]|uniref:DUF3885 domain-containing protein n=1 Tax=Paenibacillus foliorum TaxID=2654974 RepID=A0A972JZ47_9BACL|nr:DUF3885 domain-containing protein [Paenibacillus foliorum]NOU93231.1 DUF3885 domain-containing protein [Paenibacillus foliorum]
MNTKEQYECYMKEHFTQINTYPFYIYHQVPSWIRFELGLPGLWKENKELYLNHVYKRSKTIFEEMNEPLDDIFLLVIKYGDLTNKNKYKKLKIFDKYLKDKELLKGLHVIKRLWAENEDEERQVTYSYILKCKVSDIRYTSLLKAISHVDFLIKPYVEQSCFFINTTKNYIFHMYDDRGLDVFSTNNQTLKGIYTKFSDWILDYDRKKIDEIFEEGLYGHEESNEEKSLRELKDQDKIRQLDTHIIKFETAHGIKHHFIADEKQKSDELTETIQKMGYDFNSKKLTDGNLVFTATKPCQLYQHQVSVQSGLMSLVAKKHRVLYEGWTL